MFMKCLQNLNYLLERLGSTKIPNFEVAVSFSTMNLQLRRNPSRPRLLMWMLESSFRKELWRMRPRPPGTKWRQLIVRPLWVLRRKNLFLCPRRSLHPLWTTIPFTKPEAARDVTSCTPFLKTPANVACPNHVYITGANLGAPHESIHVVVDESRLIPVDVKPHLLTFGVEFCTRYPVGA